MRRHRSLVHGQTLSKPSPFISTPRPNRDKRDSLVSDTGCHTIYQTVWGLFADSSQKTCFNNFGPQSPSLPAPKSLRNKTKFRRSWFSFPVKFPPGPTFHPVGCNRFLCFIGQASALEAQAVTKVRKNHFLWTLGDFCRRRRRRRILLARIPVIRTQHEHSACRLLCRNRTLPADSPASRSPQLFLEIQKASASRASSAHPTPQHARSPILKALSFQRQIQTISFQSHPVLLAPLQPPRRHVRHRALAPHPRGHRRQVRRRRCCSLHPDTQPAFRYTRKIISRIRLDFLHAVWKTSWATTTFSSRLTKNRNPKLKRSPTSLPMPPTPPEPLCASTLNPYLFCAGQRV